MAIDAKPKTHDVADNDLERLWELPARSPASNLPRRLPRAPRLHGHLIDLVVFGWPTVIAWIWLFHPPEHPGAQDWAYMGWVTAGVFVVLGLGVYALAKGLVTGALVASVVAGALGLVLAYECRVTAQHYGNWWAYELVAFGALTGLSLAALATRKHRAL
jgi:hypothetical protein